jgi:hypothetical protein
MKKVFLKRKHTKRKDSLMNRRLISRALTALALMFTVGFATMAAAAPNASASALACGSFTTVLHRVDLVAQGATIGYGETLTDGCGNYELHGHLAALPAGSTGQYYLDLTSGNGAYVASNFFTAAPQDIYLNESTAQTAQRPFSPTTTTTNFYLLNYNSTIRYSTGDFQHLVCGTFNTVLKKVDLVAEGQTIGYLEALTDGCENKELHGHLSALPAGSTGQSYLLLEAQNDDYAGSDFFTAAPQDLYLSEVSSYSIAIPTYFDIVNNNTNVTYEASF